MHTSVYLCVVEFGGVWSLMAVCVFTGSQLFCMLVPTQLV